MATWKEVNRLVGSLGGSHRSDTMDLVVVPGCEPERGQQVFLAHELMPPDFEFLKLVSPFAMIDVVDVEAVVRRVGPLQVGCVSYQHVHENGQEVDGFLTLGTTLPLATLDLVDGQAHFSLYLYLLGRAADSLEKEFADPGRPDFF